jgi:hypothetical protein
MGFRRQKSARNIYYVISISYVARAPPAQRSNRASREKNHGDGTWGRNQNQGMKGKPAGKPGSVADSHSSWRTVTRTLQRPTRGQREPRYRPLRGLAPDGVYPAARVATGAVRSYRTISPLPAPGGASAVYFLWHFPSPRGARLLTGILLFGARTFLYTCLVACAAAVWPTSRCDFTTHVFVKSGPPGLLVSTSHGSFVAM